MSIQYNPDAEFVPSSWERHGSSPASWVSKPRLLEGRRAQPGCYSTCFAKDLEETWAGIDGNPTDVHRAEKGCGPVVGSFTFMLFSLLFFLPYGLGADEVEAACG
jgi:hypothetical protein